jgi:hypothetical protein
VGPRAGLDRCGKSRPPPGFDPRTVQPVASRYTDLAIPAQCKHVLRIIHITNSDYFPVQTQLEVLPNGNKLRCLNVDLF